MALFDSDYNKARKELDKTVARNTYGSAFNNAQSASNAIGQTEADAVKNQAAAAGFTKGQGAALGAVEANNAAKNAQSGELNKALDANAAAIKEAENNVGEEAEKMKTKQSTLGNTLSGAGTGAATGALAGSAFGPIGTAIGGVAGGLIGGIGGFFSDERLKRKTLIKDRRLLGEDKQ